MFDELYKPLYGKITDSASYLKRIGIDTVKKTDIETLNALVLAHQRSVPFENLDIYDAQADIDLGIPALYDKIVHRRRGGYCFELNAAFEALLSSLGYDCYAVEIRVIRNFTCFMPLSHRGIVVTIDGVRYFCDVGFGGPSPQGAIMLDDPREQQSGSTLFIVGQGEQYGMNGTMISTVTDSGREPILMFHEDPVDPVDFLAPNEYQSKNKHSIFIKDRLLNLITETGVITLTGNVLKVHSHGDVTEKTLDTEDALRDALKEHFGIVVDFRLKL